MKKVTSHNLEETEKIAREWLEEISAKHFNINNSAGENVMSKDEVPTTPKALIVGLSGHLGAGKTAFVKMVAKALGIRETVTSPTFVIMKNYGVNTNLEQGENSERVSDPDNLGKDQIKSKIKNWQTLVHIDLYRLEKPEEIKALNLEKVISDPKNLIMIEWPENVGLKTDIQINFKALGQTRVTLAF